MDSFIETISQEDVQEFILDHENDDIQKLLLKQKTILNIPTEWIVRQIAARKKAKFKLPSWHAVSGIIYPPALNLEQSSSEATARFKGTIVKELFNTTERTLKAIDFTGGFGVDTFFISQQVQHIDYIDPNADLVTIVKHNHLKLHAHNITHYVASAEDFIATMEETIDFAYIDPSRRKSTQKIFKLTDSQPAVAEIQELLFEKTNYIIIKTSPLFDIQQGQRELKNVFMIIVVGVENECKELLFILKKDFDGIPSIRAIDLTRHGEVIHSISFTADEEKQSTVLFSEPLKYLYEPNAAILKAGAFRFIGNQYNLRKLAIHSHLYTSESLIHFPGRTFEVVEHVKPDKKLKDRFVDHHANILTRNYPLTVEEIKKKTGLKEGGEQYLICTQTDDEKFVMIANRIR